MLVTEDMPVLGLTIKEEDLDIFTKAFSKACGKIPGIDRTKLYDLDILEHDIPSVMKELKRYSPYGEGNEKYYSTLYVT